MKPCQYFRSVSTLYFAVKKVPFSKAIAPKASYAINSANYFKPRECNLDTQSSRVIPNKVEVSVNLVALIRIAVLVPFGESSD
jgi:hypothetical protein